MRNKRFHRTLSLFSAVAMIGVLVSSANAQSHGYTSIQTGEQLRASCAAYLGLRVIAAAKVRPADCREFLVDFAKAYAMRRPVELAALFAQEASSGDDVACFALPKYLLLNSLARTVVDFVSANPAYGGKPARVVAGAALAAKYPCR